MESHVFVSQAGMPVAVRVDCDCTHEAVTDTDGGGGDAENS